VGISIRHFSCVNLRTSGTTGLMSLDVTNAMRTQIHPGLCAPDDVYYGMTPHHAGTIISLGYVIATLGLSDLEFLKVIFYIFSLSFELISQVLVFKYVLYVPLGIDHDT